MKVEKDNFSMKLTDRIEIERKEKETFVYPWLKSDTISIVYGSRGVGKSNFIMGLIKVLTEGGNWNGWTNEIPRKVLLLDGEMTYFDLKDRFHTHKINNNNVFIRCSSEYFEKRDNLLDENFRNQIEYEIENKEIDVLMIDNEMCLCFRTVENLNEKCVMANEWLLKMKNKGLCILMITSEKLNNEIGGIIWKEHNVDNIIKISKMDKDITKCKFVVKFTKHLFSIKDLKLIENKTFELMCFNYEKNEYEWNFDNDKEIMEKGEL